MAFEPRYALMEEIANWKLEAKLEDSERYFYHTRDIAKIDGGDICYIIGRKGTGKTAIGEYMWRRKSYRHFAEKLSFKNFPFNDLYKLSNSQYTPPNQYITLWKWLIYCHIAKMMVRNESLDARLRGTLEKVFPTDPQKTLARSISQLTSPELKFSAFGLELSASAHRTSESNQATWIERCDTLEDLILDHLDEATYTIVFDELDEDYKGDEEALLRAQYRDLLTGLFKAVQLVKGTFSAQRYRVRPVVFLRNDIYASLRDPDKTKWNDLRLDLTWNLAEIRNLLGFRIGRAQDPNAGVMPFGTATTLVFKGYESMRVVRKHPLIEWISSLTLSRPRDYISFMSIAAGKAAQRGSAFITSEQISQTIVPYSEYLRGDIQDEMETVLPEIAQVLNVLARIGKPLFTFAQFSSAYAEVAKEATGLQKPAIEVLGLLFRFGVIGNRTGVGSTVSGLSETALEFNRTQKIVVLRGLLPALRIQDKEGQSFPGG